MESNCYSDKSSICIEKGMGSAAVILVAVLTIGIASAVGLWAEIEPALAFLSRLFS